MFWWFLLQLVAGIATIVWLVDAGLTKDDPYLVKLAFVGAFVATWLVVKALDLLNKLLIARDKARDRRATSKTNSAATPPDNLIEHTIRD